MRAGDETLFNMFVSQATPKEIAGMDLVTMTKHIHELRQHCRDNICMTDKAIARAILEFARSD